METVEILLTGGPLDGQKHEINTGAAKHKMVHLWKDDKRTESVVYAFSESKNEWVWVDLDLVPEQLPTTGRIVWYTPSAQYIKIAKLTAGAPLPAMVVAAEKDATVIIRVFTPTGIDFTTGGVAYSKKGTANTWRWPDAEKIVRSLADILK